MYSLQGLSSLLLSTHLCCDPGALGKSPAKTSSGSRQIWWSHPEARGPGPGGTLPRASSPQGGPRAHTPCQSQGWVGEVGGQHRVHALADSRADGRGGHWGPWSWGTRCTHTCVLHKTHSWVHTTPVKTWRQSQCLATQQGALILLLNPHEQEPMLCTYASIHVCVVVQTSIRKTHGHSGAREAVGRKILV
jgi:hypothetical protein